MAKRIRLRIALQLCLRSSFTHSPSKQSPLSKPEWPSASSVGPLTAQNQSRFSISKTVSMRRLTASHQCSLAHSGDADDPHVRVLHGAAGLTLRAYSHPQPRNLASVSQLQPEFRPAVKRGTKRNIAAQKARAWSAHREALITRSPRR